MAIEPRDFANDLKGTFTSESTNLILRVLRERWPNATSIAPSSEAEDKLGSDWWVEAHRRIGVDAKIQKRDCRQFGKDDLAIEYESVAGRSPGWSIAPKALTDVVVWVWIDTGRSYCVNAAELARVAAIKQSEWLARYKARSPQTIGRNGKAYATTVAFVPIRELDNALNQWRRGELK